MVARTVETASDALHRKLKVHVHAGLAFIVKGRVPPVRCAERARCLCRHRQTQNQAASFPAGFLTRLVLTTPNNLFVPAAGALHR